MSLRLSSAKTSLSMTSSQTYSSLSVIIAMSFVQSSIIYLHCCLPTSQVADNADQNSSDRFASNERNVSQVKSFSGNPDRAELKCNY